MLEAQTEQDSAGTLLIPAAAEDQANAVPMQPDTSGEQPAPETDATSPSTPGETPPDRVDPRPRDDLGRFSPKGDEPKPDPVADAIARMSKPESAKTPAVATEPSSKAVPKTEAKAPPPADSSKQVPVDDLDAPSAEKAQWKEHTRQKFDKVLTTLRTEREARKADEPVMAHGREFSAMLAEHNVGDSMGFVPREHLAGVIIAQAAINRGLQAISQGRQPSARDIQTLTTLGQSVDALRGTFGLRTEQAAPSAIIPFAGELPEDLRDLTDVYGIPEGRVRRLAALEALEKSEAATPAPPAAPVATSPAPSPIAEPPPVRNTAGDMQETLYSRKLLGEFANEGDKTPSATLSALLQSPAATNEVIRIFPGTTPGDVPVVFDSLDARTRYDILKAAHRATAKPSPARSTLPPPTTSRGVIHTSLRSLAPDANGDPVTSAIAYMAR